MYVSCVMYVMFNCSFICIQEIWHNACHITAHLQLLLERIALRASRWLKIQRTLNQSDRVIFLPSLGRAELQSNILKILLDRSVSNETYCFRLLFEHDSTRCSLPRRSLVRATLRSNLLNINRFLLYYFLLFSFFWVTNLSYGCFCQATCL